MSKISKGRFSKPATFILLLTLWLALTFITPTQTHAQQTTDFTVQVFVDSIFIRAAPAQDAEPVSSAVENDILVAVGRNLDGLWFQVRRPGTIDSIGWISRENVSFTFNVGLLPITDTETGLIGPTAVTDTGVSVFILTEASLRNSPDRDSERVTVVPILVTIPAIARTPDNQWFQVNYLGNVGWIAEFLVSTTGEVSLLPGVGSSDIPLFLEIIPPEVQLAQVERLRAWILANREQTTGIAEYWSLMSTGEIVPCNPPAGGLEYYPVSARDIVELPELRRYTNRLNNAIDDLNETIAAMQACGIYTADEVDTAYANAINARGLFNAILNNLDNLVENVIPGL